MFASRRSVACAALRLVAALALLAPLPGTAAAESRSEAIDRLFAPYARADGPGCVVAVRAQSVVAFRKGYGLADLEHGGPLTSTTPFVVGSLAKQFTAATVQMLTRQRALSLDDDIRWHVPELPPSSPPIRVRHLLHHTSGLPDYREIFHVLGGRRQEDFYTSQDVVDLLGRLPAPNFAPGTEFLYSNTNYLLLARVAEKVGHHPLADLARELLFRPLGMRDTSFVEDPAVPLRGRAVGYVRDALGGFRTQRDLRGIVGDGSLATTAEDLLHWDAAFDSAKLPGGGELRQVLQSPGRFDDGRPLAYGFGNYVTRHRGLPMISHSAAHAGIRAQFLRFPEEHVAVACLCNRSDVPVNRLTLQVAELFLGKRVAPLERPVSVSEETLRELVGDYREPFVGLRWRITLEGGALRLDTPTGSYPLDPLAGERYRTVGAVFEQIFQVERADGALRLKASTLGEGPMPAVYERIEAQRPDEAALAAFLGEYGDPAVSLALHIERRGQALYLAVVGPHGDRSGAALEASLPDRFSFPNGEVHFLRDAAGQVEALEISDPMARGLVLRRR